MVGSSDKVKNMFKKKFPSLSSLGSDGNTSFLRAARAGHLDKVLEQLRNNVDINTSNANGLNALHLASKDGHVHVVTELLKRGANVDSATKKGNTALHIASLAGQEDVVKLLVEHGASVNVQSQNGFTPLYMAAQENHDNVVKYLLSNGANQSLATEDGFTPLAVAMQQGHDKVVAVLLENDTRGKVRLPALHIASKKDDCKAAALLLQNEHNPDVTSKSGFTPLHIASHYGNEGIANLLLNKGADVNYSAKHNITPLHVAAKWGKSNMVSLLLEKGANIESKTRDGLTPLHCAARSGHEQVVDMLLERGAPISCKTKNGLAPLHMSSQGDHVDAARILLYHRAPVDEVTVDYLTALHVAAHCGHARVAKLLLDRKADPNARALNGFTPLHIACKKNRIKVVELLLKHGASIEATTESGLTPLHVASFMGCMNIVIYLLQNDASPDVPTVRGETPLHLAARANQTDIIRILLRNGAQVDARAREQQTPLHIASRLGNVDIVMLLLQHGAFVDCNTKDLYSALHIAAKEGQDEVAAVLLDNGASPTFTTKKGFTPLHLAAKYGHMKVAKLLLQKDAPVDAQGKNGVTPLHVASHYDHQNVALLLLDKGASPHASAKNGHTPLHIAARKNQMDIATTLLEYGAKASAESKAGFTPLHLSAQEGHTDMSCLLIDHNADTNHKAKNGLTPLHLCAQEDRVNVASVLVKNGAEVDSTTKAGYTPLHVACHFGQLNMVKFLLDEGSKPDTCTTVGYTPLHQAAQQGHCAVINTLLDRGAPPNATTNQGQTAMSIAQKLGYISVVETLKGVTEVTTITPLASDEKYKVVSPETMQETFMSDSEDEGGEDTLLSEQPYRYLTVDEMKSLGDDSLPIDVRQDERMDSNRECMSVPPTAVDDTISPHHMKESYSQFNTPDNIDISKHPLHVGFLVSFLVDARGGAMRGCRHSGVRLIVPPRRASMPLRVTCRYLRRDKLSHPPPLMEGEALASRILELGPVGAKFLGPVMIEVPHFGSLRGKEREIVILRSDNGETWREHTVDCSEEAVQDVLNHSFEKEDMVQLDENGRTTRILTTDFPHYFAVVTRVRQEVHAIGPEGGMVSSSVVPQVQAVFPQGALTKKIKVGLQAQPISAELAAKLLGNRVAVSPIVTVEPRRRKFHKPITLTIPKPQAANKGMINQYSGDAPTLRLLCSITGGTTRAQWEDVTGSTPFTFVNDCVSFTTTVSARFWLMDCRNVGDATKMATELYREAIHVPFMAKFVVFAKRVDTLEARLRIFCMTDDKEDKTLEHQEHFTEVAKSRDVEVLEGKTQYVEFAGNLVPVTKSGEQLQLNFRAFRENRLPFTVRVKDPHADCVGRTLFMREARLPKGEPPQQPICVLNIVLPEEIIPEATLAEHELHKYSYIQDSSGLESYQRVDLRLSDISNLLGDDWVQLADVLEVNTSDINRLKTEHPQSVAQQGLAMLRLWLSQAGNKAQASTLESALSQIGRDDIVQQCVFNVDQSGLQLLKDDSRDASLRRSIPYSDKDIMKNSESVDDLSRTSLRKARDYHDKDDKEERKYEAEEKEVEEVKKSVTERRQEIEKRLSIDKQLEKKAELISRKISTETIEDYSEKEIAEEKRVSSPDEEPSELSFAQKRLSFEQGKRVIEMKPDKTTMKEVKERALDDKFLAEERKAAETLKEKKSLVDETSIPFHEKRKSFEQKEENEKDKKEDQKKEDLRRDSALFEGVSQGLVRLDAAFVATPQAQDLLSPKVSKTPPPSPAEFKDLKGTAAWAEEPLAVKQPKQDQSQDWAEKGKPDSTVDPSNKGSSKIGKKEKTKSQSEENKDSISVTSNGQNKITETIDIETKKNVKEVDLEKDLKYQFTMTVPDKQTYSDTLNSITTFLENEKNSNDQVIQLKSERLVLLADSEVTSSDETEESQSKSESEPKSDKSFMGKMSKKLFKVFKKDDKDKSENKKGKKRKQKKGDGDKSGPDEDSLNPVTMVDNEVDSVTKVKEAEINLSSEITKTAVTPGGMIYEKISTKDKTTLRTQKLNDDTKTCEKESVVIEDRENLDENSSSLIGSTKDKPVNYVSEERTCVEENLRDPAKTVSSEEVIKSAFMFATKFSEGLVEDKKDDAIRIDVDLNNKAVDSNVQMEAKSALVTISDQYINTPHFEIHEAGGLSEQSDNLFEPQKVLNEQKREPKLLIGTELSDADKNTDQTKSKTLNTEGSIQDQKREVVSKTIITTIDIKEKISEISEDDRLNKHGILVRTAYSSDVAQKDVSNESAKNEIDEKRDATKLLTKPTTISITEKLSEKTTDLDDKCNLKVNETSTLEKKTVKEIKHRKKDKSKKFFGGLFNRSSEESEDTKSKSETSLENSPDLNSENKLEVNYPKCDTNTTVPRMPVDTSTEASDLNSKEEDNQQSVFSSEKGDIFQISKRYPEEIQDKAISITEHILIQTEKNIEDKTLSVKTTNNKLKETKEKTKSFFGGIFSKPEDIVQEGEHKVSDSSKLEPMKTQEIKHTTQSVDENRRHMADDLSQNEKRSVTDSEEDVTEKSLKSEVINDTAEELGTKVIEVVQTVSEDIKSDIETIDGKTSNLIDLGESKAKEVSGVVTDGTKKSKEKTKSFFGGIFNKTEDIIQDGNGKLSDSSISVSEKTIGIKGTTQLVGENVVVKADELNQKEKGKVPEPQLDIKEKSVEPMVSNPIVDDLDRRLVETVQTISEKTNSEFKVLGDKTTKFIDMGENKLKEASTVTTDENKRSKEKTKSFFVGLFSKTEDLTQLEKGKLDDSSTPIEIKDRSQSVGGKAMAKADDISQKEKGMVPEPEQDIAEKSLKSVAGKETTEKLDTTETVPTVSEDNKSDIGIIVDKTSKLIDLGENKEKEVSVVVVDGTKKPKEKTKSFFGGLFSKTEDITEDRKGKISELHKEKKETTQSGRESVIANSEELSQKENRLFFEPEQGISEASLKSAVGNETKGEFDTRVNETVQIVSEDIKSNIDIKTSRLLDLGENKGKEAFSLATDGTKKSKEKSKSFFGGFFSKAEDMVKDGKGKMNDSFTSVHEKTLEILDNTQSVSKNITARPDDKSQKEKIKAPEPEQDIAETSLKSAINNETAVELETKVVETLQIVSEKIKSGTNTIDDKTSKLIDFGEYKAREVSEVITDTTKKSKEKTKPLISEISKQAGDIFEGSSFKLSDTKNAIEESTSDTKDDKIIVKTLISETEHYVNVGKDALTDKADSLSEAFSDSVDKTSSITVKEIKNIQEAATDTKSKISGKRKNLTDEAKDGAALITGKITEKTVTFVDIGKEKLDNTKQSIPESVKESKDKTKSFLGSIFKKTDASAKPCDIVQPPTYIEGDNKDEGNATSINNESLTKQEKDLHMNTEKIIVLEEKVQSTVDLPTNINQSPKGKNDKTKSFFGSLLGKAEKVIGDNKEKIDSLSTNTSKKAGEMKEISISAEKSLKEKAEELVKGSESKTKDSTKHLVEMSKEVTKNIDSMTSHFENNTKQILDGKVVDATTELDKSISLVEEVVEKSIKVGHTKATELEENIQNSSKAAIKENVELAKEKVGKKENELKELIESKASAVLSTISDKKGETNKVILTEHIFEPSKTKSTGLVQLTKQDVFIESAIKEIPIDGKQHPKTDTNEDNMKILNVSIDSGISTEIDKIVVEDKTHDSMLKVGDGVDKRLSEAIPETLEENKQEIKSILSDLLPKTTNPSNDPTKSFVNPSFGCEKPVNDTEEMINAAYNKIPKSKNEPNCENVQNIIEPLDLNVKSETTDTEIQQSESNKSKNVVPTNILGGVIDNLNQAFLTTADTFDSKIRKSTSSAIEDASEMFNQTVKEKKADLCKLDSKSEEPVTTKSDASMSSTRSPRSTVEEVHKPKTPITIDTPLITEGVKRGSEILFTNLSSKTADTKQAVGEKVSSNEQQIISSLKGIMTKANEQSGKVMNDTLDTLTELRDKTSMRLTKQDTDINPEISFSSDSNNFVDKRVFDTPIEQFKQSFTTHESTKDKTESKTSSDEKLNNILIDMLIEQESIITPLREENVLQTQKLVQTATHESATLPEKHDTEDSEKVSKKVGLSSFKTAASYGEIESLLIEGDTLTDLEKDSKSDHHSYVTTPTMEKRKIGGSQRLSREERPTLREVAHIFDYSSSDDESTNQYTVTEPVEKNRTFQVEFEDEAFSKDYSSDPYVEVTEISSSPFPAKKKQRESILAEKTETAYQDQVKQKTEFDKNIQKVERRFERMASETIEADPVVNYTADREFQRMVSQLSSEEVDACLNQWDEEGLTPSEELDSTKDTVEGDLDPEVEALPEAFLTSTNPFCLPRTEWVECEQDINNVPPSVFWAFDTTPTTAVIKPNDLDIPIKALPVHGNLLNDQPQTNTNSLMSFEPPLHINTIDQSYNPCIRSPCALTDSPLGFGGESAGEETSKSPIPPTSREGEEALMDFALGSKDTTGSGASGPSGSK